jgi:hypothetical protein
MITVHRTPVAEAGKRYEYKRIVVKCPRPPADADLDVFFYDDTDWLRALNDAGAEGWCILRSDSFVTKDKNAIICWAYMERESPAQAKTEDLK